MRVAAVILDLQKRFPRSPIEAWEASYYDALRPFEGPVLDTAFREIMREWSEPGPPKPAHIAAAVKIPVVETDRRKPWEIADENRLRRARQLYQTACREVGAKDNSHLHLHLYNQAYRVARLEGEGKSISDALAYVNGRDVRLVVNGQIPPPRPPDVWVDEWDMAIFDARVESHKRVRAGGR